MSKTTDYSSDMENTIVILGFVQSVFGFLIFITKRPRHLSFYLLSIWMLVIAVFLGARLLPFEVVDYFKPGIFPILFLFGPLLYLYVRSLATENFRLKRIHLLHLLPIFAIITHRSLTDPVAVSGFLSQEGNFPITNNSVYFLLLLISLLMYWILSVKIILIHRKNIPFYFSNYTRQNTLNWLIFVILFFLFFFFSGVFTTVFSKILGFNNINFLSLFTSLAIFTFVVLFFGINQSIIYKFKKENAGNADESDEKYKRSVLDKVQIDDINQKMLEYLRIRKPYLNADFSFQMMVDDLGISRHKLSQVINTGQNKNFYKLINEFRVAEVKEKLVNQEHLNLTVLGIAFECGFNSKTTFNRIFKEETGMTPTEYIKYV